MSPSAKRSVSNALAKLEQAKHELDRRCRVDQTDDEREACEDASNAIQDAIIELDELTR